MITNAPQPIKHFIRERKSETVLYGLFASGKVARLCTNPPADYLEWITAQPTFDAQMSVYLDKNYRDVK
jgi:hypothetical protein